MNQSSDTSTFRALHRLVEHYTPAGTLGRTLLGGTALLLAPFLFFGGTAILLDPASLFAFLTGLFAFVASIPTLFVGIVTLWPVYLSLIGNVESPELYPEGASAPGPNDDRESAETILKRRYAAGEISREEFERQLNAVMGTTPPDRGDGRDSDERDRDEGRRGPALNR